MGAVEQFLFERYLNLDPIVHQVVALIPDREFYKNELSGSVLRCMRRELDGLIYQKNKNPDNKVVQQLYQEKLERYDLYLNQIVSKNREAVLKKLLSYGHDKKLKLLLELISRYRLLKYLDRKE